ncbi:MAG: DUF3658 domain-containing protein [Alphaproteobacteria bacterium]|nr:DUF3658 domain-containing protein [Alphaproteobacteria bacterium]
MKDEQEIDSLVLSLATARWQKTAMVIARVLKQLKGGLSDDPADKVAERIEHLVRTNRLESQGNLSRWRYSEIRHPGSAE